MPTFFRRQTVLPACIVVAVAGGAWLYASRGASAPTGPAAPQPITVAVVTATRGPINVEFEAVGSLRANEAVTVTAKVPGIVREISFNETDEIRAGQVLVRLDDEEARANLAVAEAARRNAVQLLERAKALVSTQAVSRSRVDELQAQLDSASAQVHATEARVRDLTMVAPFAGKTGLRRVSLGALIAPGTEITTLDDISVMRLEFAVPDSLLANVAPGQVVKAYLGDGSDARAVTGTVRAVDTRLSAGSRQAMVQASLPNESRNLRPGMFLRVRLELSRRDNVVLVPEEALVTSSGTQFVYVVQNGKAVRRPVTIGSTVDGLAEVRKGVEEGEQIVTRGTIKLRDGAPVKLEPARTSNVVAARLG
ncbi:efflux RND transporter periplasmic adaptor subunit [Roseiterribacter gracilis]|uniref:MexH family multidrug efflux RND transporter periplasmic adaptor subunit n=1 Tax=Roseiterribacter gracilis TaxID=2812848 RepID=A0A8S8X676_9PROT|nr:MexH family multidrug efflux RND transporter periplasmic adaptor subunit [Rhodospirillales bacterium TMPK1]